MEVGTRSRRAPRAVIRAGVSSRNRPGAGPDEITVTFRSCDGRGTLRRIRVILESIERRPRTNRADVALVRAELLPVQPGPHPTETFHEDASEESHQNVFPPFGHEPRTPLLAQPDRPDAGRRAAGGREARTSSRITTILPGPGPT